MAIFYSKSGSTAKQNGLLLAVAMCARQTVDPRTKAYCYQNLSRFCRKPTQLFMFIRYCRTPGNGNGWTPDYPRIGGGHGFRRAVSRWYLRFKNVPNGSKTLAVLVTKYRKRNGWSHQDALRVAHPKAGPSNGCSVAAILKYIAKGFNEAKDDLQTTDGDVFHYLQAVEDVRAQRDPTTLDATSLAGLVRQHHLTREHLNTQLLNFPDIWEALLENMPMTAMIRNLGKMSAVGILSPGSQNETKITGRLGDVDALSNARIHPFNVLLALLTYKRKKSPNKAIVEALDSAFYLTFTLVEPTNKRYLLAVNVSSSMFGGSVNGCSGISPGTAAAALALVTARTERHCEIVAFSNAMVPLEVGPHMKLSDVVAIMRNVPMGGTDCSLPMQYALENMKQFDVFVVFTDSETDSHHTSPAEALRQYRRQTGISEAKLIVCAMESNSFTIADPDDLNMLDMVGFDSSGPEVIRCFVAVRTKNTTGLAEVKRQRRLVREYVSTPLLNSPDIWEALLGHKLMTVVIRNMGKMSAIGMLSPGSQNETMITGRHRDINDPKNAKIHQFNVLLVLLTYAGRRRNKGHLTWAPNEAALKKNDFA
ncbi:60 kDa SS-A/Ro ribonucleoprotein [Lamellibrachia satsuma]|nr:60 kDa SS-A/Ro ribonucleoprotein [Lamellibrachia satsuma]